MWGTSSENSSFHCCGNSRHSRKLLNAQTHRSRRRKCAAAHNARLRSETQFRAASTADWHWLLFAGTMKSLCTGIVVTFIIGNPLFSRCNAEANFFAVPFGVEGEQAGKDFVAEVRGPEQAALISVVVLIGRVEEDGLGARRKIVPAIGFEH